MSLYLCKTLDGTKSKTYEASVSKTFRGRTSKSRRRQKREQEEEEHATKKNGLGTEGHRVRGMDVGRRETRKRTERLQEIQEEEEHAKKNKTALGEQSSGYGERMWAEKETGEATACKK